jgi:hypothetical protein
MTAWRRSVTGGDQLAGLGLLSRSDQLGDGKMILKFARFAISHGQMVCFSPSQPIWVTTPVANSFWLLLSKRMPL